MGRSISDATPPLTLSDHPPASSGGSMAGRDDRPDGFSEEALRGLYDLEGRLPPPAASPEPLGSDPGPVSDIRPHYWGHRERLRKRFLDGGHAAMPEYELLELVLFN